jgi:hypothetical protein
VSTTGMIPTAARPVPQTAVPAAMGGGGGGGLGAGSRGPPGPHMMPAAMMPVVSIAPPPGVARAAAPGAAPPAEEQQQQQSSGSLGYLPSGPRSPAGTPVPATGGGAGGMSEVTPMTTPAPQSQGSAGAGMLRPNGTPGPQSAAHQHSLLSPVTPPMLEKQPLQQPDS